MYSAISQSSALVPAWLGKDLISVKRPFCLFVCLQSGSGTGRNEGAFIFRTLIWQDSLLPTRQTLLSAATQVLGESLRAIGWFPLLITFLIFFCPSE